MNTFFKYAFGAVAAGVAALAAASAGAAQTPTGVWIDHTGRAAVEIANCGGNLCGKIVWLKDPANNKEGCNLQIIGNVKPVSGGKWDGGWILDPEKNSKYDVELTPLSNGNLKVMGYAGMKFLSETFTWTRAAPDLQRCDVTAGLTPTDPPPPAPANGKQKQCKLEFGGIKLSFDCDDD